MGRHLSPCYGQVILVSGYPVLTAVNWSQHWCAISFYWAPKLARKCESKHWFPCGADGRSYGHVITKFSRMGRLPHFLSYGAPSTRALRARVELRYYVHCLFTCMFRSPMEWTYEHDVRCTLSNPLAHKKAVLTEDEYGIWFLKVWIKLTSQSLQ